MNLSTTRVASVAFFALLLCTSAAAQNFQSSATSEDGTQRGSISFSEDSSSTRGSVSSSSVGGSRASASSSLTIGPTGTQASFSAQGDDQAVSRTVVTGEPSTTVDAGSSSGAQVAEAGFSFTNAPGPTDVEPQAIKEDTEAEGPHASDVAPREIEETESAEESGHKKACVINDQAEFERQLDLGYEVTHVKPHGNSVEIVTELRLPYASTRSAVVTQFIPENIHERCGVTYVDLGLENREGDGYSSLSGSSSFHFSSSSASDSARSADYIRQSVLENLCSQDFFRNFALYHECSGYGFKQPW